MERGREKKTNQRNSNHVETQTEAAENTKGEEQTCTTTKKTQTEAAENTKTSCKILFRESWAERIVLRITDHCSKSTQASETPEPSREGCTDTTEPHRLDRETQDSTNEEKQGLGFTTDLTETHQQHV